jgi:NADH dehydrogenase
MAPSVVVLGSGYAGTGAVRRLEAELDGDADLTWISNVDHHLVLHESHRCIREPAVAEHVVIPVDEIAAPTTEFVTDTVTRIDTDRRAVYRDNGDPVEYDFLLVGLGSRTAFFGIEGLRAHAHTLKSAEDAIAIHRAVSEAAATATPADPTRVVVGGAGLSGIQAAGELAELRDEADLPIDIVLVEGLDEILPGKDSGLQAALRARLADRAVEIRTGEFVGAVDDDAVYVGEASELAYDVLVWTGGITGRAAVEHSDVDQDDRSHRIHAGRDFRTDDDRVFAVGDAALVDQPGDEPAPPTAQAAWQAADVAGANVARAVRGDPIQDWTFDDKGTVVSVGESAVAHGVKGLPLVDTFGGRPAQFLKKAIAARWIKDVAGWGRALRAWPKM